jgi:pimeloyl-ACP methyl ester carboxylesterase
MPTMPPRRLYTIIFTGHRTSFVDHEHLRYIATDVRAVEIKNSGHSVAEEQPDAVASALIEFLPPPE